MALIQEMAVKIDQDFLAATLALFTPVTDTQADRQKVKASWYFGAVVPPNAGTQGGVFPCFVHKRGRRCRCLAPLQNSTCHVTIWTSVFTTRSAFARFPPC